MAEGPSKSEDGNSFWIEDGEPGEGSLQNKIGLTLLSQWGQTTRGEWREKIKSADRNLGQL